jgi:predicted ester cyclase
MMTISTVVRLRFIAATALALLWGCTSDDKLADVAKKQQIEKAHLETFDDLDFNVYSGQKWDQLGKSHAKDIIVHWPDDRTTKGIDVHIEDLKAMFVFAPDTRIKEHPIKIASGEWTAVTGIMEGTFTRPMPIGGGKTISPTGKPFKLSMVTIGRWENGVMVEEWLMWDNQAFMKQIGLVQ